jgi:ribonuclease HII
MICGVDEAGKGAVLGPLVVAAVAAESHAACEGLGLADSKVLSPKRREALYEVICGIFPVSVVRIGSAEIDDRRKHETMNEIVAGAHALAIASLLPLECAVCDACDVDEGRYAASVASRLDNACPVDARHHADQNFPLVGAASIVAKVCRDREVRNFYAEYGNVGSGYPSDPVTIAFLKHYIASAGSPPPIARSSWKTVQSMIAQRAQTTFSDY